MFFFVYSNKNELSIDGLTNSSLIVFGNSQEQFSIKELDELKVWLEGGGRALFLLNSNVKQSNLSEFLTR